MRLYRRAADTILSVFFIRTLLYITPNPDLPDVFRESPDFQFLHRASAVHAGVVAVSGGVYLSLYMLS